MTHGNFQIPIPAEVLAEIADWHKVARIETKNGVIQPHREGEEVFFQMTPWGFWRYRIMRGDKIVKGAICSGDVEAFTSYEPVQLGNKAKFATSRSPREAMPTSPPLPTDVENIAEGVRVGFLLKDEALALIERPEDRTRLQALLDAFDAEGL